MKQFTAYLAILLILLILYYTYETLKVKEGHKIDRMWHTDEQTGPDGVKHSHPLAWATNIPGEKEVDYIANSGSGSGYTIPDSVIRAENNGYTCLPIDSNASHHEMINLHTENSPVENGLDDDGSYTTTTSSGTIIDYDELTTQWKTTLENSDYEYPKNRNEFWNKITEMLDEPSTNSQKYTLWNIISNIISGKLSNVTYDYHIDKAKKDYHLAEYAEKNGKLTSTVCDHYHSANSQLTEILNDDNGYHTGIETSLQSKNPLPCEGTSTDAADCIYGWKEDSLSSWKTIHSNIKNKIDNKCS
tara:strand:+ start:695 stop:1600 length:906 start_codon:yes stop_codon:yes gene_type:complete